MSRLFSLCLLATLVPAQNAKAPESQRFGRLSSDIWMLANAGTPKRSRQSSRLMRTSLSLPASGARGGTQSHAALSGARNRQGVTVASQSKLFDFWLRRWRWPMDPTNWLVSRAEKIGKCGPPSCLRMGPTAG